MNAYAAKGKNVQFESDYNLKLKSAWYRGHIIYTFLLQNKICPIYMYKSFLLSPKERKSNKRTQGPHAPAWVYNKRRNITHTRPTYR